MAERITDNGIDELYQDNFYMGMPEREAQEIIKEKEFLRLCNSHLKINLKEDGGADWNGMKVELLFNTSDGKLILLDEDTFVTDVS